MTVENQEGLAPAAGGVEDDGVREVHPVQMWGKTDELDLYDFSPKVEEEVEVVPEEVDDPKDSSAPGSALAAIYEKVRTPDVDWSQRPETPASVVKEPIPAQPSESGSSTGSETQQQKNGKPEPPA